MSRRRKVPTPSPELAAKDTYPTNREGIRRVAGCLEVAGGRGFRRPRS
ncbi:MAG: hypothetical protein ACFB50_13615 [Rubrobacteraceae bacterium]